MKNLSKHQYLGQIPQEYKEFYEASFFGTTRKYYKPQKITYNNEFVFFVYRPAVKYFLLNFASNYSKEDKKEVYEAITQGYNIGIYEYNNTFDLTEAGAERLLKEIERLQNIPFKETQINFAELKDCGKIEGRINCIYGIMDSNEELFKTHIISMLVYHNILHSKYEKEFILLLNKKLNSKILFDTELEFWRLILIFQFLSQNNFVNLKNETTQILDYICNNFDYKDKKNKIYSNNELREKLSRYFHKIKNESNYKKDDFIKLLTDFSKNNNFIFSL